MTKTLTLILLTLTTAGWAGWYEEPKGMYPGKLLAMKHTPLMKQEAEERNRRSRGGNLPEVDLSSFTTVTVSGWHCVEQSSVTYLDLECHAKWERYYKYEIEVYKHGWAVMTYPPSCEDKTEQHCIREMGYRSDGVVVWRRP